MQKRPSLRKGCDYVDISLVDGWTLPVKLDIKGDCSSKRSELGGAEE